ncbi:hypothetical protein DPMN_174616 [Dreissena polymorpha]|uniref:Uncharacterized protein n=1 Tax=Dreissena polymorpha TaxID=45954 RepID=A0A9D4E511_DREPO|nr:hypothetical protein DPMN_174616 [Dreissena polymorpha]
MHCYSPITGRLLAIPVKAVSYIDHVTEAAMLKVSILMRDTQRDNLYVAQETFRLRTPDLNIKCYNSSCQVDREVTLRMSFSNPLDQPLTQSYLYVESAGADDPRLLPVRSTPAACEMTCDVELTFQRKGRHLIYANFFCKDLHNAKGVFEVYVQ